jgi:dienelactone hydrolase
MDIDPAIYNTLDYTTLYADALASAGYIVLHPNLLVMHHQILVKTSSVSAWRSTCSISLRWSSRRVEDGPAEYCDP